MDLFVLFYKIILNEKNSIANIDRKWASNKLLLTIKIFFHI